MTDTATIPDELRQQALTAVRATDPNDEQRRARAVKALRDAGNRGHFLPDLIAAVDWALTHDTDPARYVTDYDRATGRAQYSFPNGHSASVIPDPKQPMRFEVSSSDPADAGCGQVVARLTSEQAEAKLATVAALPAPEPTMAWVAVDDRGRVTEDATVTVGEWTWPVPPRTALAGVLTPMRIGHALRERGWRGIAGAEHDTTSRQGFVGIPVEPIETTE